MSFVGTRPEAVKYVEKYKNEYMATLLLPAGITSEASIRYKDEATLRHVLRHLQKVVVEERKEWGFRLVVVRWKSVYKINYIIEKYGKLFVFWSC